MPQVTAGRQILGEYMKEHTDHEYDLLEKDSDYFVNTKTRRIKRRPGTIIGERIVHTAGYIPLKTRIEQMVAAGLQLQAWRESEYPEQLDINELNDEDNFPDIKDEIEIMQDGMEAEEALMRRKPVVRRSESAADSKTRTTTKDQKIQQQEIGQENPD